MRLERREHGPGPSGFDHVRALGRTVHNERFTSWSQRNAQQVLLCHTFQRLSKATGVIPYRPGRSMASLLGMSLEHGPWFSGELVWRVPQANPGSDPPMMCSVSRQAVRGQS